tara:strand:+ start:242 stop:766 length:525 start_codon:yes stop_codon:yes gene_type:complete
MGRLAQGDVFGGEQDPIQRFLMAGQNLAAKLDIEPLAGERVIDGVAGKGVLALEQLDQLIDMAFQHVVAKHLVDAGDQLLHVAGFKQIKRLAVYLQDPDRPGTRGNAGSVGPEKRLDIRHAGGAPTVEKAFYATEILDPHGDGREFKHLFKRAVFQLNAHNSCVPAAKGQATNM